MFSAIGIVTLVMVGIGILLVVIGVIQLLSQKGWPIRTALPGIGLLVLGGWLYLEFVFETVSAAERQEPYVQLIEDVIFWLDIATPWMALVATIFAVILGILAFTKKVFVDELGAHAPAAPGGAPRQTRTGTRFLVLLAVLLPVTVWLFQVEHGHPHWVKLQNLAQLGQENGYEAQENPFQLTLEDLDPASKLDYETKIYAYLGAECRLQEIENVTYESYDKGKSILAFVRFSIEDSDGEPVDGLKRIRLEVDKDQFERFYARTVNVVRKPPGASASGRPDTPGRSGAPPPDTEHFDTFLLPEVVRDVP